MRVREEKKEKSDRQVVGRVSLYSPSLSLFLFSLSLSLSHSLAPHVTVSLFSHLFKIESIINDGDDATTMITIALIIGHVMTRRRRQN